MDYGLQLETFFFFLLQLISMDGLLNILHLEKHLRLKSQANFNNVTPAMLKMFLALKYMAVFSGVPTYLWLLVTHSMHNTDCA